jgi:molybdopterin molybdotransferase
MLEELEARQRILERIETGPVVWLPFDLALGGVSAQDIRAIIDFPEFDNSSMDGYAIRAEEGFQGAQLSVSPVVQVAGINRNLILPEGGAIRIFTGAPVPAGANAVIMQEDVRLEGSQILIQEGVEPGENIRRRGGDVCTGQKIMARGDTLTPARLALLASQGFEEVAIYMRPMIQVVTTGDELVQPGEPRLPGQIYDSNGILLKSSIEKIGGVAEQVHLPDNPGLMGQALGILCEVSDFVVIAGGVSVGERDYVKEVLNSLGIETNFWKVRVKPGKPFLFGQHPNGCVIFGLPGNPVSAFVTFQIFVAPALHKRLGRSSPTDICGEINTLLGRAGEDLTNPGDRPHYLRAFMDRGKVHLSGRQESHAVFGLSQANCLVRLEPEQIIKAGEVVFGIPI